MDEFDLEDYSSESTIAEIGFEFQEYTNKVSIIGYAFAQFLERINKFLFFIRTIYQHFEPIRDEISADFANELFRAYPNDDFDWNNHFRIVFSWNEQKKFISELLFTKIANRYLTYLVDMASYVIDKNELDVDKKAWLRSFPKIKKCYRDNFNVPLFVTDEDEKLGDQLITIRNIVVHGLGYIPDNYYAKFHNWEDLQCIKQDSDILHIEFDFITLEKYGEFLAKSIAELENRLVKECSIDQYYFTEDDIPNEYESYTENIDEDLYNEE